MSNSWTTLRITDGTTTINLVRGDNFRLVAGGWSPSVPRRHGSFLGGRSIYEDVVESITVNATASTTAELLDAITDLSTLLDQAQAWSLGEDVDPVWVECQPQQSTLAAPLKSLIVGPASNDSLLSTPSTFNDYLMVQEISGLTIAFRRRGLWLGAEQTAESWYQIAPGVMSASFSNAPSVPSPTKLAFVGFGSGVEMIGDGFMVVTGTSAESTYGHNFGVFPVQHGDITLSAGFTCVAEDADKGALGGCLARIDASSDTSGTITLAAQAEVKSLYVFACIRNNSSSTAWKVRAKSTGLATVTGRWVVLDGSDTNPAVIALGRVSNEGSLHQNIILEFETGDTSGTLDVNYVAIAPDTQDSNHIAIVGGDYSSASRVRQLVADHRALEARTPLVFIETGTDAAMTAAQGWVFRDEFATELGVGSVDGTKTMSGHTRSVNDPNTDIDVSGGALRMPSGNAFWGSSGTFCTIDEEIDLLALYGRALVFVLDSEETGDALACMGTCVTANGSFGTNQNPYVTLSTNGITCTLGGEVLTLGLIYENDPVQVDAVAFVASGSAGEVFIFVKISGQWRIGAWNQGKDLTAGSVSGIRPIIANYNMNTTGLEAAAIRMRDIAWAPSAHWADSFTAFDSASVDGKYPLTWDSLRPALSISGGWTAEAGTFTATAATSDHDAVYPSALSSGVAIATADPGIDDFIAECRMETSSMPGYCGLIVRWTDADNYVRVEWNGSTLRIVERLAGIESTLDSDTPGDLTSFIVRTEGTEIFVWGSDGTYVLGAMDAGLTDTAIGLFAAATSAAGDFAFHNITIRELQSSDYHQALDALVVDR